MKEKYILLILLFAILFSCGHEEVPDWGPNNIQFTPKSGKAGDIITITGEDFFPVEKMKEYKEYYENNNYKYEGHSSLVLFNVDIYYTKGDGISFLHIDGTTVIEFIEFDTNKIVCKIPTGAKSGKIWVNGYYAGDGKELHHPSEEEFIVYDESGDIVR